MSLFTIKEGKHKSSGFHFGLTFRNKIACRASLTESCLYQFNNVDDLDINKLFGFSTSWFHQFQSARIGWRCKDGVEFEILTYSYNKGERSIGETDLLGIVQPNEEFECVIEDTEIDYIYRFKKTHELHWNTARDPKSKDWWFFHYLLWPYFGGDKVAPHEIHINLEKIKI